MIRWIALSADVYFLRDCGTWGPQCNFEMKITPKTFIIQINIDSKFLSRSILLFYYFFVFYAFLCLFLCKYFVWGNCYVLQSILKRNSNRFFSDFLWKLRFFLSNCVNMILNCRNVSKVTFQNSENKRNIFRRNMTQKFKSGKKRFWILQIIKL